MSKFFDYIKSKETDIGLNFLCKVEIEKTEQEDKVIIHYKTIYFNLEEEENQKKDEGLRYLVSNNNRSIDVYMNYGNLYVSPTQVEEYVKEGKRLKRLFKIKELREFKEVKE